MSKSLRQSHGASSAAVGSPASLPRLSRSPGTSWWPQAPVPALGKAGAEAARALPCRHSTCSGNVGSSSSPGDDGPGFGGIKPRSLRVLAQPWLLRGTGGISGVGMGRADGGALQEPAVRMEMETMLGWERWGGALWEGH